MSGSVARRGGLAGMFIAGVTAVVLGFGSVAHAGCLEESLVNVVASGAGVTALSNCLSDAQDGAVEKYMSDCEKSRTEEGFLNLEDVFVKVFEFGNPEELLYSGMVDIAMLEGTATEIVSCLNGILESGDIESLCAGLEAPMQFVGVYIEQLLTEILCTDQASAVRQKAAGI